METIDQPDPSQDEMDLEKRPVTLDDNMGGQENSSGVPEIKSEPQEESNVVNTEIEMPMVNEPQESSDKVANLPTNLEIPMETNEVRMVKQEPDNDEIPIETNMPIAKDSNYIIEKEFAIPVPTDDFLDGIATAIAPARTPRLRVKTEFSLRENLSPQKATVDNNVKSLDAKNYLDNIVNEETPHPPPPPPISSNSTSDLLADGIATPRITLLALNRVKVKTESVQPDDDDTSILPADFFNDILKAKSPKEAGEVSGSNTDTDSEDIPPDFFDDLLQDNRNENIEQEEKYSDRLKEKERLKNAYKASMEKSKDKRRHHKKQKKSKKKSKKRSRSPANSETNKERDHRSISPFYSKESKRIRRSSNSQDSPSFSKDETEALKTKDSLWSSDVCIRVKQEFEDHDNNQGTIENVEEIEESLTPKQKRERAIKRATALLNHIRNSSSSDNFISSTFKFVSTVRKLPTSQSYVQQQIYENRSPLHTINNVNYKFNSYATNFNMEEWGLAALSPRAAKLAKLIGCDAQFIYEKLKSIKIPAKLRKVKQENMNQDDEEGEELVEASSSLFCNVMTQTDNDIEYNTLRKGKGYDIGVQAAPSVYSIGSQTLETQSPTENLHKDDEAPIMNIIRDLNENQLMAVHSFAELIKGPASNTSAMDMYKIQMKIQEIYKISQIPSALATSQNQVTNNYTTIYNSSAPRRETTQQNPIIQSVKSADGTQFSINDPRKKSLAYAGRIINNCDDIGTSPSPANIDPRFNRIEKGNPHSNYHNSRPFVNERRYNNSSHTVQSPSSTYRQNQQSHTDHQPPTTSPTIKRYGRGGLRR